MLLSTLDVGANDALQAAQTLVDRVSEVMTLLGTTLDLERVDQDALLDGQDYDPELLFEFVREQIRFEAYAGALRGAEGTLVSQAGNALDQALLLATLLNEAGLEARIVRGQLGEVEAVSLVGQLREPRVADSLALDDPSRWNSLNAELAALNPGQGAQTLPPVSQMRFYRRVMSTNELLQAELRSAGHQLAPYEASSLVETTRDYFWVEMRETAAGPWQALHPAFRRASAPSPAPKVLEIFTDSLPESLQHRLRVEVFIDQRVGSETRSVRVAGPWERPVSNLHGEVLSFYNQPNTLDGAVGANELDEALSGANLFVPMLHGAPGTAFDLLGQTIDIDSLAMDRFGASAVIQTVGGKAANAAGALQGLGAGEDAVEGPLLRLTGQWMVFTLVAPGGEERSFRRDLLPPDSTLTEDGALRKALAVRHDYLAAAGRFSETFAAAKLYERYADVAPAWKQLNTVLFRDADRIANPERLDPSLLPFLALIRGFDSGERFLELGPSYRPSPTLVILHSGMSAAGNAHRGVDIVTNDRVVLTDAGPILRDPMAALKLGVWETAMETLVYPEWSPDDRRTNTFAVFEVAEAQAIDLELVERVGDTSSQSFSGSEGPSRLAEDLEAGYIALLPGREPEGLAMNGWWRIDPVTGQTLGKLADGRGSELKEYLISTLEMAVGTAFALSKYLACDQYANDPELKACCLIEAHFGNVGGNAFGGALGAAFGGSVAGLCETGGILAGQIKSTFGEEEPFQCRIFDD
ncbi:MAG: hypothetical protein AAGH19_12220, partial [Pseudomonadota bacterium]